jgi:hypothetical protein
MGILLTSQSDRAVHEIPETTDSLWENGVPALQLRKQVTPRPPLVPHS